MNDLFALQGRTALVTGASSGLGRHFAKTLSGAGATILAAARREDALAHTVADIEATGGVAHAIVLDVTDADSVRACFDRAADLGIVPDLIVNNAGVARGGRVLEQDEGDWDTVLDTNLKGAWLVAQEGARRLVAAERPGSIVNIASITGIRPAGGVAPYATSKAGLIHLTKVLALELARYSIRVNALAPGYVQTDMNEDFLASDAGERLRQRVPQRRFGRLEDLDGPLLLLASDAGAYMTGSVVEVDGGHLASTL